MEGVITTQEKGEEDRVEEIEEWSDMGGIEREGLFASRHASELGASIPTGRQCRRSEGRGRAKRRVRIAVPTGSSRVREPKGSAHQQRRQSVVDAARAEEVKASTKPEAVAVRTILKRPETAAAGKVAKEKEKGRKAPKAAAQGRWEKMELSGDEEREYFRTANPIKGLDLDGSDEEEKAAARVAYLADMRAVEVWWEGEQDRAAATGRIVPPPGSSSSNSAAGSRHSSNSRGAGHRGRLQ